MEDTLSVAKALYEMERGIDIICNNVRIKPIICNLIKYSTDDYDKHFLSQMDEATVVDIISHDNITETLLPQEYTVSLRAVIEAALKYNKTICIDHVPVNVDASAKVLYDDLLDFVEANKSKEKSENE